MMIIADSGASKTSWAVIRNEHDFQIFQTPGSNPFHTHSDAIAEKFIAHWPTDIQRSEIDQVFFFGAGCSGKQNITIVNNALNVVFPNSETHISSDITGAAIALFGEENGIACILGTGSNAALWDGKQVYQFTRPLGYILGDEGSGARIGIAFLNTYLRSEFDNESQDFFSSQIQLTIDEILDKIYRQKGSKEFLASFLPLISKKTGNELIRNIIIHSFSDFIRKFILRFPGYQYLNIRFCGSTAYYFSELLDEALNNHSLNLSKIIQDPLSELINRKNQIQNYF